MNNTEKYPRPVPSLNKRQSHALRQMAKRLDKDEDTSSVFMVTHPEDPKRLSLLVRVNDGAGLDEEVRMFGLAQPRTWWQRMFGGKS